MAPLSQSATACSSCVAGPSVHRRSLLLGTAALSLAAAGLTGLALPGSIAAHAELQDRECRNLVVFSKRAVELESGVSCEECECEGNLAYDLRHGFKGVLTEAKCDETGRTIPEGSVLSGDVERWLRVPGPCGTWLGSHRGTFQIETGGTVVIDGEIAGTDGFDSRSEDVCCHPEVQEGVLFGTGAGELKGCEFVASYYGMVPFEDKEKPPCEAGQWRGWELILAGVLACPCEGQPPGATCVEFTGLTLGDTFVVGDSFSDAGVTVKVIEFEWSSGMLTSGGFTEVENGGMAGGSGNELEVNNVNLAFDFGGPVAGVTLAFGEYGGNLNIEINGDFQNFNDFPDIAGAVIGGVNVAVTTTGVPGGQMGTLSLTGTINSFAVGGQELWIDDVCYTP